MTKLNAADNLIEVFGVYSHDKLLAIFRNKLDATHWISHLEDLGMFGQEVYVKPIKTESVYWVVL